MENVDPDRTIEVIVVVKENFKISVVLIHGTEIKNVSPGVTVAPEKGELRSTKLPSLYTSCAG